MKLFQRLGGKKYHEGGLCIVVVAIPFRALFILSAIFALEGCTSTRCARTGPAHVASPLTAHPRRQQPASHRGEKTSQTNRVSGKSRQNQQRSGERRVGEERQSPSAPGVA